MNPDICKKGFSVMELFTHRLIIRSLTKSDLPSFEKTLNEVTRTCMGSPGAFLDWLIAQYENMDITATVISFGIFNKETGELLGTVGAGRHDDLHEPEIFYHLLPEFRRHGYATEAAAAITKWAFENYDLPYLIGTAATDNIKSQNVLERCGYQYMDTKTLLVHVEGKYYDFKYYRCYKK